MKKLLIAIVCAIATLGANAQETKFTANVGFLFPSTLNATFGVEKQTQYGHAWELFGEIGNHWKSGEGQFWKGYYWDGGLLYKHRIHRYKNGCIRFRFGPQFGAVGRRFFLGIEAGFEYNYVFGNGMEFSLIQKNNVNFLHGDTFRNGLLIGLKIPF